MLFTSDGARCGRVSVAVARVCAIEAAPPIKAQMLRELAAWYRAFAARAAIWEARLFTADDLDAQASRIDPKQNVPRTGSKAEGDNR
jgi:hypothetical protein